MKYINNNIVRNIMIILPAVATLFMFCYVVQHYALNLPLWDDYYQSLVFVNNYVTQDSITQKALLLIAQHNEHRIFLVRLIVLLYYKIFGILNFKILIVISQIILLSCIIPLYILFDRINKKQVIFNLVLIFMLILCPVQSGTFVWFGSSLQQNLQLLFALSTMCFLLRYCDRSEPRALVMFIILMISNVFIGGSWVCLFIATLVFAIFQRNIKLTIIISITIVVMATLSIEVLPYKVLQRSMPDLYQLLTFIRGFTGSTFIPHEYGVKIGVFILILEILLMKNIFKNKTWLLWSIFFFVTAVIIGVSRQGSNGLEDKYAIYSLINLGMIIVVLINVYKSYFYKLLVVYIILLLNMFDFKHYQRNIYIDLNKPEWKTGNLIIYPDRDMAINIYLQSKKLGIYNSDLIDQELFKFKGKSI